MVIVSAVSMFLTADNTCNVCLYHRVKNHGENGE